MRLAVLVTALVLGGAAPALAQSAESHDDYPPDEPVPASISLVKTASPTSVPEPGGEVTFTVVVGHDTPEAGPVVITALVDDVHGDLDGRGTCAVPQILDPGGAYTCSFAAHVAGAPGYTEVDTVTAAGTDETGAAVYAMDSASVSITDVPSLLVVEKDATPGRLPASGGEVSFRVAVENASAVDAITVKRVVDDVFGDIAASCEVALPVTLAPGEGFTCSFVAELAGTADAPHVNVVTVTGRDDDGVRVTAADDAVVHFDPEQKVDPIIDLELVQDFTPGSVTVGDATTLTVRVTNQGPDPASGVVVAETLPAGITYVGDDGAGSFDPASGAWVVGDLAVGASAELQISATVDAPGEHSAVGEVVAADQVDIDSEPADGTGDDWDDAVVGASQVLATSSLGDTVWLDANANGVMDDGESGFQGVRIKLTKPDGTEAWQTTGADGRYLFVGLVAGDYTVRVYAPDGWAATTSPSVTVALGSDAVYLGADFGLAQALPLTGMAIETFAWLGAVLTLLGAALLVAGKRKGAQPQIS